MSRQPLHGLGGGPEDFDDDKVADGHEESGEQEEEEELVEGDEDGQAVVAVQAVVDGDGRDVVVVRERVHALWVRYVMKESAARATDHSTLV